MSIWDDLKSHHAAKSGRSIADLFAADPGRFEGFSRRADGMLFDFSKTTIDARARILRRAVTEAIGRELLQRRAADGAPRR